MSALIDDQTIRSIISKHFDLDRLAAHMEGKYLLSEDEAPSSIRLLVHFFAEKATAIRHRIVLPQVADWAWHECILDTRAYSSMCRELFGTFLDHIKDDAAAVARFTEVQLDAMMIQPGNEPGPSQFRWRDSGFYSSRYRFNSATDLVQSVNRLLPSLMRLGERIDERFQGDWLVDRLCDRFGLQRDLSDVIVAAYINIFTSHAFFHHSSTVANTLPSPVIWAWQEHVLSTMQYRIDCEAFHMQFVHFTPPNHRAFFSNFDTDAIEEQLIPLWSSASHVPARGESYRRSD